MTEAVIDKNSSLIAAKWAKALMELALEDDSISKKDMLDDLKEVSNTISSSEELSNVIDNPAISVQEKQVVLCKLFQNNVMPIIYNFIFALNLKKRVNLISRIAAEFEKELDKEQNLVHVGITSAIGLNEDKKEDIKNKISEKLDKNVIVDWNVDEDIIAGLIFKIDELIVDNSVRHKLEDLSKVIIKG